MSIVDRLSLLLVGLILTGWLYWLTGKVLLVLTYAEQVLGMGARLLALVPGKSTPPTEAPADEAPRPWFQTLRRLAELRDRILQVSAVLDDRPAPDDDVGDEPVELARWADDGGATWTEPVKDALTADPLLAPNVDTDHETEVTEDETPTETFPPVPATEPVERVEIAGGLRLPPEGTEPPEQPVDPSPPIVDDVDLQLVRFGLRTAEGHRP